MISCSKAGISSRRPLQTITAFAPRRTAQRATSTAVLSAADDRNHSLERRRIPSFHPLQESQSVLDTVWTLSRDVQTTARPLTATHENGIVGVPGLCQELRRKRFATVNAHPQFGDAGYFVLDCRNRKTIRGNSPAEGASGLRHRFVDIAGVTQPGQKIGRSKAAGAGPNDSNLLLCGQGAFPVRVSTHANGRFCQETLDGVNGDRLIELPPVTDLFTGMMADAATDSRKRVFEKDGLPGVLEKPSRRQQLDAADVFPRRAGDAARGRLLMVARSRNRQFPVLLLSVVR